MECIKPTNFPFNFVQGTLRTLNQLGGFPFEVNIQKDELKITKRSFLKLLANALLANISSVLLVIFLVKNQILEHEEVERTFAKLDVASGFTPRVLGLTVTIVLFGLFLSKRRELQDLMLLFAEVSSEFNVEVIAKRSLHMSKKWIAVQIFLKMCFSAAIIVFAILLLFDTVPEINTFLFWAYLAASAVSFVSFSLNSMIISADLITYYLIHYMKQHFYQWRLKHEVHERNRPVLEHVLLGLRLCHLTTELNRFLSPFLLCQMSFCMIGGTFSAFSCSSYLFDLTNVTKFSFSIAFIFFFLYVLVKMFFACTAGQMLEDEINEAKVSFETYASSLAANTVKENEFQMKVLMSRLGSTRGISPKSFFSMNHRAFLGAFAIIFTYFIVLLQFRIEEKKSKYSN